MPEHLMRRAADDSKGLPRRQRGGKPERVVVYFACVAGSVSVSGGMQSLPIAERWRLMACSTYRGSIGVALLAKMSEPQLTEEACFSGPNVNWSTSP